MLDEDDDDAEVVPGPNWPVRTVIRSGRVTTYVSVISGQYVTQVQGAGRGGRWWAASVEEALANHMREMSKIFMR